MEKLGIKFERREGVSGLEKIMALVSALIVSFLLSSFLIFLTGADVTEAFVALYEGAFGSWNAFVETLVKATPLIMTGLSVVVVFKGKIWSIGAEGQFFAGAMASYWVINKLAGQHPLLIFIAILIAGFLGGAICGLIPGYLKARLGIDEVIVTVMLNYIIIYLLTFLLSSVGPWRDPTQFYYWSAFIPEEAQFPRLFSNARLHAGFIVALVVSLLVYWMFKKTRFGFEVRAVGLNITASKFKGVNVANIIMIALLLSGGIAGLAGAGEVAGLHYRLKTAISKGYGYTGIIIAMLAELNPFGVIPAAILFGGLINGSNRMQVVTGVPVPLVYVIQATTLFFILATTVLSSYRIRRIKNSA